ncbi:hypothetical protein P8936_13075 [Edaphobacter paludis]|uniref:Uncharacterized protein n=1 Tax=Edaphobacter paludis TaxID=3035702 RepID=A0AAU7DDU7_9BACT
MALGWGVAGGRAQGLNAEKPLPDIPALMHEVETHQKEAEAVQKDYLYHAVDMVQQLDGNGRVKKTETEEYDVFWVEGVQVHKLTKKNGKELSAGEQQKQNKRIDKEVTRARERRAKAEAEGKTTDSNGYEEVTVSRLLELGSFSNARRVMLNGRKTIAVDYVGDPKARTRNRLENLIRDVAGTVWVDEDDDAISKLEGHFLDTFKIGAGLVVNIQKGTSFSLEQRKINDEVWLPVEVDGRGTARVFLLFRFNGNFREVDSGYRKFKVTSTILPGIGKPSDRSQ